MLFDRHRYLELNCLYQAYDIDNQTDCESSLTNSRSNLDEIIVCAAPSD